MPSLTTTATVAANERNEINEESPADPLAGEDYQLTITVEYALRRGVTPLPGDATTSSPFTFARYRIEGYREAGVWGMRILPVLTLTDDDTEGCGDPVFEVQDQSTGLDPFALLDRLLGGRAVHADGDLVLPSALDWNNARHAASPALRAELDAMSQSGESFQQSLAYQSLQATPDELDRMTKSYPEHAGFLGRVRDEGLLAHAQAQREEELARNAAAYHARERFSPPATN